MLKKVFICSLLLQGVSAIAQTAISVQLPASGDFAVFTSHGIPTEIPATPASSKGGPLNVTSLASDDTVSVWDKKTGNLGSRSIAKLKGSWTVADTDLDHIAQIQVIADHNGAPISSGVVTIDDGIKRPPVILDPKSQGAATFFDVKPGKVSATVSFKGEKAPVADVTQILKCDLARDKPVPDFTIAIAQNVDTVTNGAAAGVPGATSTAPNAAKTETPPNGFGVLITYFFALAVAAGVIYTVIAYFKKEPGTVQEKLERLGVQIPKPDDQAAINGAPVPVALPKPEPPQKILLDDAAPTPLSAPLYTPVSIGTLAAEPSLLNAAGIAIPLLEGETLVGRDAGLGLSLTGESSISRKHASIVKQGTTVTVNDLGSTNGTYVNGARLQSPVILRPGDTVQFGSVSFRYQG